MHTVTLPWPLPFAGPLHGEVANSVWTTWSVDPAILVAAALAGVLYARGLTRLNLRRHAWWRTVVFYVALVVVVLAIESPVDPLGEHHFTFHMVQHELFLLIAAPLLLVGAPLTPMLLGAPRWVRRLVARPIARSATVRSLYRALTWPVASNALLITVFIAWHVMPGWYDAALRTESLHQLQHLSFLVLGLLYWVPVIGLLPVRSRMNYVQMLLYQGPMVAARIALGMFLATRPEPSYEVYADVEAVVSGLTGMTDQGFGVAVMWMFGVIVHLAVAIAIFAALTQHWEQVTPEVEG